MYKHAGSLLWTNWEYPYSDQWDPKQKLFSYMIFPSEAQPCDLDLHEVHVKMTETSELNEFCLYQKMLENRPSLKSKNNATSFSRLMILAQCLDAGPPLAFVYIQHFCRVAGSKDPNHQCVRLYSTHFDWTSCTALYLLALLSSLHFAVYNATTILNQWRHLALNSELPGANSITSETFWAVSTNHREASCDVTPHRPIII